MQTKMLGHDSSDGEQLEVLYSTLSTENKSKNNPEF
jgi:hypothetical protein